MDQNASGFKKNVNYSHPKSVDIMNSLKIINNAKAVNIPKTIFKPFDILGNFIVKVLFLNWIYFQSY